MINLPNATARKREWLAKLRLRSSLVRASAPRLAKELDRVASAAASSVAKGGTGAVDVADHESRLERILEPTISASATAFAQRAAAAFKKALDVGIEGHKGSDDALRARIANIARNRSRRSSARVAKTTQARINKIIARGVEKDKSRSEIADEIRKRAGGKISKARARVIAETEVHSASNAGELAQVQELGVPVTKEWASMKDELVRPDHQEADGEVAELDEAFDVGDDELMFPGDPDAPIEQTINCRCIMVYNSNRKD